MNGLFDLIKHYAAMVITSIIILGHTGIEIGKDALKAFVGDDDDIPPGSIGV